jgi:hypothetical protein
MLCAVTSDGATLRIKLSVSFLPTLVCSVHPFLLLQANEKDASFICLIEKFTFHISLNVTNSLSNAAVGCHTVYEVWPAYTFWSTVNPQ